MYSKSPTNNQGGPIYESKYGSVSDAPSGWTTVALNTGGTYRNDGDSISRKPDQMRILGLQLAMPLTLLPESSLGITLSKLLITPIINT